MFSPAQFQFKTLFHLFLVPMLVSSCCCRSESSSVFLILSIVMHADIGAGFTSTVCDCTVDGIDEPVVVKVTARNDFFKVAADKEALFYSQVAPFLQVPMPRVLRISQDDRAVCIVMQKIDTEQFQLGDQQNGFELNEFCAARRALERLQWARQFLLCVWHARAALRHCPVSCNRKLASSKTITIAWRRWSRTWAAEWRWTRFATAPAVSSATSGVPPRCTWCKRRFPPAVRCFDRRWPCCSD